MRQPTGPKGIDVANHLSKGNAFIVKRSIECLDIQRGDYVIEVGMANGYFVADILSAGPGTRYFGIDFSDTMVEEALRRNSAYVAAGWASFIHGNALCLPVETGQFDAALTVNTVYFWEPLEQALRELHRVLKTGGRLAIGFRPRRVMQAYPFAPFGFTMYSGLEMAKNLEKAGFSRIQIMDYPEPTREFDGTALEVATCVVTGAKG